MKKILGGKQYNTDTARALAEYSNNLPREDFGYIAETLYVTKAGSYFIHGRGGAKTQYAQETSGSFYSGGEKIVPVSEEIAQKFIETNCSAEVYERIWGDTTDDGMVAFSTRVPKETKDKLDAIKAATGMKKVEIFMAAIDAMAKEYLE